MRPLFAVLLTLGVACSSRANGVGYLDVEKVLTDSESGKQNKAEINAFVSSKQRDLDVAGEAFQKAQQAKESPEALKQKRDAYEQAYQRFEGERQQRLAAASAALLERAKATAAKVAGDRGLSAVLPIAAVYAREGLDLTADVIKRIDAESGASAAGELAKTKAEVAQLRSEVEGFKAKQTPPTMASKKP